MRFNNKNWELPRPYEDGRFYLKAKSASTIGLSMRSNNWTTFEYSLDKGNTWNNFTISTSISLATGEKAYFRAKQTGNSTQFGSHTTFTITGNVKAVGNIMWLYDYENPDSKTITYTYSFFGAFAGCTGLTDASELYLPATTISTNCYQDMFNGCTGLVHGILELPATSVLYYSYGGMFNGCSNIENAPVIKALSIGDYGCMYMFTNCAKINRIDIYANTLTGSNNFQNWTNGVAATGNFYNYGSVSYSTGVNGIPTGWTSHVTTKYAKVNDWSSLDAGDQIIFVEEATGRVATTAFNLSSTSGSTSSYQAPIMSDETVTISNNEFLESDLANITHATYSGSQSSVTYDAKPLKLYVGIETNIFPNPYHFGYYDATSDKSYLLQVKSLSSSRKLALEERDGLMYNSRRFYLDSYQDGYEWRNVLTGGSDGNYGCLLGGSDSYGNNKWIGNYESAHAETAPYSPTWTYAIYKKVIV